MSYYNRNKMSKRGEGGSKQDDIGNTIYEKATNLLDNRMDLLCPFDVEDPIEEIWQYAMEPDEWKAWRLLKTNEQFREAMSEYNRITVKADKLLWVIPLANGVEIPHIVVEFDRLPGGMQRLLYTWAIRRQSFANEYDMIRSKITELCRACNTPGQIRRVWPELLSFMPDAGKRKIFRAKANSPYPEDIVRPDRTKDPDDYGNYPMVLRDEWKPAALEWMNMVFTESLVLPIMKVAPLPKIRQT